MISPAFVAYRYEFNDSNITDKFAFEKKLNLPIPKMITDDIALKFSFVLNPLISSDRNVTYARDGALGSFNGIMSMRLPDCPINDGIYTQSTISEPWKAHESKKNLDTAWYLRNTGAPGNYSSRPLELNRAYISRVYNPAGKCKGSNCCLNNVCGKANGTWCNGGTSCVYICQALRDAMLLAYPKYLTTNKRSNEFRADLGVSCPAGYQCPSVEYQNKTGFNRTAIGVVHDLKANLTRTRSDLLTLSGTTIGNVLTSVQDLLCNMKAPFLATRYYQVHNDLCVDFLGGFAQITLAIWFLSCVLHMVAALGAMLVVRLQGSMNSRDFHGADDDFAEIKTIQIIKKA